MKAEKLGERRGGAEKERDGGGGEVMKERNEGGVVWRKRGHKKQKRKDWKRVEEGHGSNQEQVHERICC